MAQALAMVKRELGSEAVILHTRRFKQGGLWGFGGVMVVEITAADARTLGQKPRRRPMPQTRPVETPVPARPALAQDATAGDLIRRTYALAKADLARNTPNPSATSQPDTQAINAAGLNADATKHALRHDVFESQGETNPRRHSVHSHMPSPAPVNDLAVEMQSVKRMVASMMRKQQARPKGDLPDKLFDQYLSLLKQEVTEEMAEEVVSHVQSSLSVDDMEDSEKVRKAVAAAVASLIPTDEAAGHLPARSDSVDGRPRTIALIGPTGVGKTTTIAKLAATFKLKQKKSVGLITLDTYRIAAVDQLRTYASIIGVPLHVAASPEELVEALGKLSKCDVVLIDTAGRSQRNDPQLQQLRTFIQVADPHEVHLVLSSTCAQSVLMEAAERFSSIRVDRIIFTKLDEAVSFGVLLNVARKVNKRLSYVTTGQEVPHQIEPGTPGRLAALVMGEEI